MIPETELSELEYYLDRLVYFNRNDEQVVASLHMKIEGYFDASGKHDSDDLVIVVAGLLASHLQWRKFDKAWSTSIEEAKCPIGEKLPVFHTTDFQARVSPYTTNDGWSQDRRDNFYKHLVEIINNNTLHPVGIAIYLEDYNKFIAKHPESVLLFGSAGNLAACLCFLYSKQFADKLNYHDSIAYFFDRGDEFASEITYQHAEMCKSENSKASWRFKSGGLSFVDKEFFTPIQAADVVAWELSKDLKRLDRGAVGVPYRPRPSLDAIAFPGSNLSVYAYEDLIWLWTEFGSKIREELEGRQKRLEK